MTSTNSNNAHSMTEYLIARIAKKDNDALRQLYEQTYQAVYGFAYSLLKNPHDAQDIVQEAYVKIYSSADKYKAQGKPMAWILTITKNLAFMKQRQNSRTFSLDESEIDVPADGNFTDQIHDNEVVNRALSLLSDESRQIVLLHVVSGLKHREIAELLDLKLPTVLSKYNRAIAKIQSKFKEDGIND